MKQLKDIATQLLDMLRRGDIRQPKIIKFTRVLKLPLSTVHERLRVLKMKATLSDMVSTYGQKNFAEILWH